MWYGFLPPHQHAWLSSGFACGLLKDGSGLFVNKHDSAVQQDARAFKRSTHTHNTIYLTRRAGGLLVLRCTLLAFSAPCLNPTLNRHRVFGLSAGLSIWCSRCVPKFLPTLWTWLLQQGPPGPRPNGPADTEQVDMELENQASTKSQMLGGADTGIQCDCCCVAMRGTLACTVEPSQMPALAVFPC